MPRDDRTPRRLSDDDTRTVPDMAFVVAILGLVALIAGIGWLGVRAINTSTAPGYYLNERLYFRPAGGEEQSIPAPGAADTNDRDSRSDARIRVYYDPIHLDKATTDWYAVWLGPIVVVVIGTLALLFAGGLVRSALAGRRDGGSSPAAAS